MNKRLVKNPDGTFLLFENDFISQQILQGKPWEPHFREVISLIKDASKPLPVMFFCFSSRPAGVAQAHPEADLSRRSRAARRRIVLGMKIAVHQSI